MSRNIIFFAILTAFLTSCHNPNSTEAAATSEKIKAKITGKDGEILTMIYDNANETAMMIFNDDTINLKRNLRASGIRYSNHHYMYDEHQGVVTVLKDNHPIFKSSR